MSAAVARSAQQRCRVSVGHLHQQQFTVPRRLPQVLTAHVVGSVSVADLPVYSRASPAEFALAVWWAGQGLQCVLRHGQRRDHSEQSTPTGQAPTEADAHLNC